MPHDFILQRITISISTLSKYVREKKNKKIIICTGWYLHPVQMPPCHIAGWRAHLYQAEAPPGTNVRHLYRLGWIRPRRTSVRGHLYLLVAPTGTNALICNEGKNTQYK